MRRIFINIGSNLGDRVVLTNRAVALLKEALGERGFLLSEPFESEPWGFDSPNRFLNIGLSLLSDLDPLAILGITQRIELLLGNGIHRNPDGSYADRLIDIDIIAIEGIRMAHPHLTLPHPCAAERDFVMQPLFQTLPSEAGPNSSVFVSESECKAAKTIDALDGPTTEASSSRSAAAMRFTLLK